MAKTIAVSPNLNNIKDILTHKGYNVISDDNTTEIIDALIFSTKQTAKPHSVATNHLTPASNNEYVLLINGDEKSPDEIIDMIEQMGW